MPHSQPGEGTPSGPVRAPYPYPAQPYPAQPYPAQPHPAQPYPAQPYPAQPYPARQYPAQQYPAQQYQARPYPVRPYPAPPVTRPPRRRRARRWVLGTLALLLVCSVVGVGGLVGYADYSGQLDTRASWRPAPTSVEVPPAQNAPAAEWADWALRSVDDSLGGQAEALLAGDEEGFVALVDPGNTRLMAEHKRRFTVLHAMGPGAWSQEVTGPLRSRDSRTWDATVKISYCFGEATCRAVAMTVVTQWRFKDDQLLLVRLDQSTVNGPRPWETDDLSVAKGKRVVVAAPKSIAWRLKDAAADADRAAAVADAFARWEDPPDRYVIFLAGPSDWNQWYGHEQPDWAAAWAVPVSATMREIVVQSRVVDTSELEQLLTHELIHVASLAGKGDGIGRSTWWLIEGVAEYGSLRKQPVREHLALAPIRAFMRDTWDGDPAVEPPARSASLEDASARYAIGYLAVRRIAEKYGQAKMLDFFGRVVHDAEPVDEAAPAALAASWSVVKADCAAYVRTTVG